MRGPQRASAALDADLARLGQQQLVVLELDQLDDLLSESEADPFALRRGPFRAGIEDLVLTLTAAERLPEELTVRVELPTGTSATISTAQAQAALRQRANDSASAEWRQARAVHSMGRRQVPVGSAVAVGAAILAYLAGYLATVADSPAVKGLCAVMAGIAITIAWVVSWMVVETTFVDWRESARRARAYDLLARATLEVVVHEPGEGDDHERGADSSHR